MQDFVGAHGRVADENQFVVIAILVQDVPGADALGVTAAVFLPHIVVEAVVEVKIFEVFELALGGGEHFLA